MSLIFDRDLTFKYHEYNRRYFKNKLPNIEVHYGLMKKFKNSFRYGYTLVQGGRVKTIVLNQALQELGGDVNCWALLHEMIHARYPKDKMDHGAVFKKEVRRLLLAGAFDDLV